LLIVVEDLHWSDDASLEFLLFLSRRISPYPVLLLLSYRSDETLSGLGGLLAGLDREQIAQEIKLAPFTRDEVGLMLRSLLDLDHPPETDFLDAIYELTEGNPFFVEEVCTSLVASGQIYHAGGRRQPKPMGKLDIPDSIHRIVEHRIQQLSQPARQVVDLAAIGGRSFDFAVLQALTGHTESQLLELIKELTAAQLVVEESADRFAFRHALTREALYARLLARERQTLHGQIAHALEHIHADALEAHLETLTYNFYEAAMWTKTLAYAQRAGAKAQTLYAPRAAIEQFTRALEAAGRLSLTPPLDLYRLRGEAFDTLGEFDQARADYEAALGAARAAGDQRAEWQTLLDLGMLWASHDYARSGDYCRQALDLARSTAD
jgi:predicted ATPase